MPDDPQQTFELVSWLCDQANMCLCMLHRSTWSGSCCEWRRGEDFIRVFQAILAVRADGVSHVQTLCVAFPCRTSRLAAAAAAAAAGRNALGQPASGSRMITAGALVAWKEAAACLWPTQQAALVHTGRSLHRAEPAEELQEDHRAALRSVTPKVPSSSTISSLSALLPARSSMSPDLCWGVFFWVCGGPAE